MQHICPFPLWKLANRREHAIVNMPQDGLIGGRETNRAFTMNEQGLRYPTGRVRPSYCLNYSLSVVIWGDW